MNSRIPRLAIALAFVLSASMVFSTNAFAVRAQDVGCTGLDCYGSGNGGYGNHLSGSSGSGSLAGYSQVRFDGYRPEPGLEVCTTEDARDRAALSSLGLLGSTAPRYIHRRVAISRSDNVTATNGVEGSLYWDSGLDFNLNTGATRPSTDLERAPSHSNPWIGPHWKANVDYCLPLAGGVDIQNELSNKRPEISVLYKGNEVSKIGALPSIPEGATEKEFAQVMRSNLGRTALRMKNLTLRIVIEESSSTSGGITITFEQVKDQININVGSLQKFFEFIESGSDPEKAREIWVSGTSRKSPLYINFEQAVETVTHNGTTTTHTYDVPIVVKRKGLYSVQVDANYNAYFGGNNGTTIPFTGLSGSSDSLWVNAVAFKSVNRR